MAETPLRFVKLWAPDIDWQRRDDGSWLVWQREELGAYPLRLSDRIHDWAEQTPDRPWMAERDRDGVWQMTSYRELLDKIQSIGQALLDLGLSSERPLVILSGNSVAHALMALGAQYVGIPSAALAPAYALSSGSYEKLFAIREQITPGAVFVERTEGFEEAIASVFADLPLLACCGSGLARSWDVLLSTPLTDALYKANQATGPETIAKFMFTSGTTGTPKAVITTQRMLCSNAEVEYDICAYLRDEPPVFVDWAPWNHVASGNKIFNMTIYGGGTYYIDAGRPTPSQIGETIRNLKEISPNWYWNVPVGFELLVHAMEKDEALARSFYRNLRFVMYAGAAMADHTWKGLDELAVKTIGERVPLCTGLGATETAPTALSWTEPEDRPGNIGVPVKGVTLKLVPHDEKWEARVKGVNITPGYWRNETLTKGAFDEEGFYRLGDALRFAEENNPAKGFFFDGRIAENFKLASGTWVAVGALRARLIDKFEGLIRDAVITGEGQNYLGALLIPFRPAMEAQVPEGHRLDDPALFSHPCLREHIARRLAVYNQEAGGSSMRIERVMIMQEPLSLDRGEVTDKGSVNQRAVRQHRADLVAGLYEGKSDIIKCGKVD